ncbi:Antigenic thaumatin-like protein [Penicillium verhagenii]|uniref:Antigenic thaumatin-like protein n=1 Tax=Penicillium verhagenii TaxID=1562060 RepID=UPI002545B008|nr:Antigenic thaumatin-like protein [Penicillium verhagenii]KAJ5928981.1 Antigenic thaumatin-like protein [Penicillium verhagenii]
MKLSNLFEILSLATLAASHPGTKTKKDGADTPWGAFPSPAQSFVPWVESSTSPAILRVGQAVINNHCPFPIYIWSVGSVIGPEVTTGPNGRYVETFRHDPKSGGIAIKISTSPNGLLTSSPLTVFAYNLSGDGKVWYDLSDVFGDPFRGHSVVLEPSQPGISWRDGSPPAGSGIRVRDASNDLVLTLC